MVELPIGASASGMPLDLILFYQVEDRFEERKAIVESIN